MPHSMTGFSTAEETIPPFRVVWEIRSVNHRFLELAFRMPDELRSIEPECRGLIGASVTRGKVDCTLKIVAADANAERGALRTDALTALKALEVEVLTAFPDAPRLTVGEILRWPGVMRGPEQNVAGLGAAGVASLPRRGGSRLSGARGSARASGSLSYSRSAPRESLRCSNQRSRCSTARRTATATSSASALDRLDVQAEPERLEQELALIAQRIDVAEEVDRLEGHVAEIRATLARAEPIGRRLDFLIQELNREANTFASKVQDETLTRTAVELKVLIEQMREQVQNLE